MSRYPFSQPLALVAALTTAGVVALAMRASGGRIVSPGGLSTSTGDGQRRGGVVHHAELAALCERCHAPPLSSEVMSDRCLACHDETRSELARHSGLHGRLGEGRRCLSCHTEHGGPTASLTHLDPSTFPHEATGFSLAAHRRTRDGQPFACADCHEKSLTRFEAGLCESCHRKLDPQALTAHVADWGRDCQGCHDGRDRFSERRFAHGVTRFPLAGKHQQAACTACHAGVRTLPAFSKAESRCAACHATEDPHGGRFGQECGSCHDARAWKPATFDHARTAFPLDGAHARVPCAGCHRDGRYEHTPTECRSCHTMPADHRDGFGDQCASCHGTTEWRGATLQHRFPITHGSHRPSPCKTCHEGGYRTYTCYGCHEHTPANVQREHWEEGIRDLSRCARCHTTGSEHEGEGAHGEHGEHGEHEEEGE